MNGCGLEFPLAPPPRFRLCMRAHPFSFFFESVLKLEEDQDLRRSQINRPWLARWVAGLELVWLAVCECTVYRTPILCSEARGDPGSLGSLHAAHQKLRSSSDIAEDGHIRFRTLVAQLEHPQQGNPKTQPKSDI